MVVAQEGVGTVAHVGQQALGPVDGLAGDVEAPDAASVGHDEVFPAPLAAHVHVGAHLEGALGAHDHEPTVSPGAESRGR